MFDVAVVGLGLVGSGALRELADAGLRVVGIGPGEPPVFAAHTGVFASHYDSGRITRHLDPVREWAVLAARAIEGYATLEQRSGIAFHRPVGVVLSETDPERIASITAIATDLGVATTMHDPGSPFDERLAFPAGSTLLTEAGPAGHVDPRRMLAANLTVARATGATVIAEAASGVHHGPDGWTITTASGDGVEAGRVVVATGAHSDELHGLDGCPTFDVRGETIIMATLGAAEQERLATLPSMLVQLDRPDDGRAPTGGSPPGDSPLIRGRRRTSSPESYDDLYVVPPTDYPDGSVRLKLGATLHDRRLLTDGAARREWMSGDEHLTELEPLRELLTSLVPGLVAESWETKPCLITQTASGLPVVDHLAPGLVLAAGCNGFAAKSANAIGALAARLVLDGRWTDALLDQRRFRAQPITDR